MANVILIEDDTFLASLLTESLTDAGHSVRPFVNATDAIAAYREDPADVLITDIIIYDRGRPVPDGGLMAAWRIKSLAKDMARPIAVIAITGSHTNPGMEHIMETIKTVGADIALPKPFLPEELLDAVDLMLNPR